MREIPVSASKHYLVTIGHGLLPQIGDAVQGLTKAAKICIVSDDQVWPLHGQTVTDSFKNTNVDICHFVFSAGENSKNIATYTELLNFLATNNLTRSDCILALGGGVVGDLAGFAAATYLRGIPYIQVPTTLLAMVDSSVGGKTAIDLPCGKNLCGAFYQPIAVFCDMDTLSTLPEDTFRDGCAEVIKYGILYDAPLFAHLEETGLQFDRETVISRCIEHKRDVVARDEFDTSERMLLNLGHTIGHAIERCSRYAISHGKAVAMGMSIVSRASCCADAPRITALLCAFGLPTATHFSADQLADAALQDKKRSANTIHLILPHAIGHCSIVPTPTQDLRAFIEKGL